MVVIQWFNVPNVATAKYLKQALENVITFVSMVANNIMPSEILKKFLAQNTN